MLLLSLELHFIGSFWPPLNVTGQKSETLS